jgi:dTDP-glucose pyrophosphorylase
VARLTQALLLAAGRGLRAYPRTHYTPKVLLEVDGESLLLRNLSILRDAMGIRDVTLVVGHLRDQVCDVLGNGSRFGIRVRYVECREPERGLAHGILLAKDLLTEPFVVILGDELYLGSNHAELQDMAPRPFDAICGVMHTSDLGQIRRNYAVWLEDGRITRLVEKPTTLENDVLGCGTFVLTPAIFDVIARTPASPRSGRVELIDAVGGLAGGGTVLPFWLTGHYVNVNTIDDHNLANYIARTARFPRCTVSVVIPAYDEEESIGYVVRDFRDAVAEVFVVDNSSHDRTAEVARAAGARVETVRLTGYGDTIRYGLDHATGDILVVVEADSSFRSRDLSKLLEYLKDADMVIGTRTTRELIEQGTNMRGPVRWGNVLVAKGVELLWWGLQPRFTDVGCTYRALWRATYDRIRPRLHGVGPELSPEMMVAVLQARMRIIEVPVSYHRRMGGESKHSANYFRIARTALRMVRAILTKRLTGP